MLSPNGAANAYFAEFGWVGEGTKLPDDDTLWQADGDKLTADKPLTLTWDNGQGVRFSRDVHARQELHVHGDAAGRERGAATPLKLYPFGRIRRTGTPAIGITRILQEGPIGAFGKVGDDDKYRLSERQYHNLPDEYRKANVIRTDRSSKDGSLRMPSDEFTSVGGWLGITDKYWLVALVPDSKQQLDGLLPLGVQATRPTSIRPTIRARR